MINSKKYFQDSFEEAITICKEEIKECLFIENTQSIDLSKDLQIATLAINFMKSSLLNKKIFIRKSTIENNLLTSYKQLFSIGIRGLRKLTEHSIQTIIDDLEELIIKKQKDYGKGNIMIFEHVGIMVRVSDKIERLKNLLKSGMPPQNESINDSYRDIINYALIGIMVQQNTFMRELNA